MEELRTNLTFGLSQASLRKSVLFDPLGRVGEGVLLLRNLRDNPGTPVVTVIPIVDEPESGLPRFQQWAEAAPVTANGIPSDRERDSRRLRTGSPMTANENPDESPSIPHDSCSAYPIGPASVKIR